MVLPGNDRRAYDELLKGEIGHFRSEVGLDNRIDMVSSNWLPIFLYYTTDRLFKNGFQKRLAIITIKELVKLPYANPHYILPITPRIKTTTPIQLAVSSIDVEYGIEALKSLLSISGDTCHEGSMITYDGYTVLDIAKSRNIPKMVELLDRLNMTYPLSNNNILNKQYNNTVDNDNITIADKINHNIKVENRMMTKTPILESISSSSSSNSRISSYKRMRQEVDDNNNNKERISNKPSRRHDHDHDDRACCCICKDNDNNIYNGLIKCDKCKRYAHKTCYKGFIIKGGKQQEQEIQRNTKNTTNNTTICCLSCRPDSLIQFKCGICNMDDNKGSLMIYRSDLPGQFVHLRCALFIKPDRLRQDAQDSNDKLEIIGNLVKIGRRRHCYICSKPGGFRCGYPGCNVRYHITCLDNVNNNNNGNDDDIINNYGGYKRIIRGPGKKIIVNNNIAVENFERMTKCSHSYLRIYCSKHINDNLCICGNRITDNDKDNNITVDCCLKDKGCVYGTLHKRCMMIKNTKARRGLAEVVEEESSSINTNNELLPTYCPHCEFCISSFGKLPLGPCINTCIYCNYAYRDRIISSDEESDGEELGINDNNPHKAVLPKHRPNVTDIDKRITTTTTTKRRRKKAEKMDNIKIKHDNNISCSTKNGINNNNNNNNDDVITSDIKVEDRLTTATRRRVLEDLIKECVNDDDVLIPWLLIDVLKRNSINNIDDLILFLATPRLSFIIPENIRHKLEYNLSATSSIIHKSDDNDDNNS